MKSFSFNYQVHFEAAHLASVFFSTALGQATLLSAWTTAVASPLASLPFLSATSDQAHAASTCFKMYNESNSSLLRTLQGLFFALRIKFRRTEHHLLPC